MQKTRYDLALRYPYLLFDFDGTIADSSQAITVLVQATYREFGITPPSRELIISLMGLPIEKTFQMMLPTPRPDVDVAAMISRYRQMVVTDSAQYMKMCPGMLPVLVQLKALGARIGIVTSKKTSICCLNCDQLSIGNLFEAVIGSDECEHHKPDPRPALLLLAKLGGTKAQALVVGDATFDIDMGNNAGIDTCAVTWGAHPKDTLLSSKPAYIIQDAAELLGVVRG